MNNNRIIKKIDKDVNINAFSRFYCRNLGLRMVNGEYHVCFINVKRNDIGKAFIAAACDLNELQPVERKDFESIEKINDMFVLLEETSPYTAWVEPNNKNKMMDAFKNIDAKNKLVKLSSYVCEERVVLTQDGSIRRDFMNKEKTVSLQTILKVAEFLNEKERQISEENE